VWLVTLRDLQWRRWRVLIGVVAAGLVFAITLLLTGMSSSFHNEVGRTVDAFGADGWLVPAGTSGPFTSVSAFPEAVVADVAGGAGVREASPVVVSGSTVDVSGLTGVNVIGVDAGVIDAEVGEGREVRRSGEVVADESLGADVGDRFELGDRQVEVVGTVDGLTYFAGTPTLFVSVTDAQALTFAGQPVATAAVVRGDLTNPPRGYKVLTNAEVEADLARPLRKATQTIDFMKVLLWLVAAGIVGSMVYLSVLERTRDFAVLKATGATNRALLGGLVLQAVVLAGAASLVAEVLAMVLGPALAMRAEISGFALITLPLVAVAVSLLASAVGLRRTVRTDPALAFS
jgi:putative ABC transport system permease protein